MLVRRLLSSGGGEEPTVRKLFPIVHVEVTSKRSLLDIQQVRQLTFRCVWVVYSSVAKGGRQLCGRLGWQNTGGGEMDIF
jgi:hypothetical protein